MASTTSQLVEHLRADQVEFHPHSLLDPVGRVFNHCDGIYRAIRHEHSSLVRRLLESPGVRNLMQRGLIVQTDLAPMTLEGADLVLQHRRVPYPTYPEEWPAVMIKDAALAVADILEELGLHGLTLKDTHLWNILFDGTRPVHVDFSSIVPVNQASSEHNREEFLKHTLNPLTLMSHCNDRLSRLLMVQPNGVQDIHLPLLRGDLSSLNNRRFRAAVRALIHRIRGASAVDLPGFMRDKLHEITIEASEYLPSDRRNPREPCGPALATMLKTTRELQPSSVLGIDLGPAQLDAVAGQPDRTVVSLHVRPTDAHRAYVAAKLRQRQILPLLMDFVEPTPARGLASHRCVAASDRLRCELVLAPGLIEDVLLRYRRVSIDDLAAGLALFAQRWAVVDFSKSVEQSVNGCSLEAAQTALRHEFERVQVVACGEDCVLICEK